MGRNENRQVAKFNFNGYKIEMYRPTEGQGAAIATSSHQAGKKSDVGSIARLFRVLESLVVNPDNWEAMDDGLVTGAVDIKAFTDLVTAVFTYEWDGEEAKKTALAQQMHDKAVDG